MVAPALGSTSCASRRSPAAIAGDAPFFEKFYVGDFTDLLPDRVLELAPDRRQPPNFLGTDIVEVRYGDFAGAPRGRVPHPALRRARVGLRRRSLRVRRALRGRARAASSPIRRRGYRGLSRFPVDLTCNLGLRIDTKLGGVTLAFSNLLGLVPARNGERK